MYPVADWRRLAEAFVDHPIDTIPAALRGDASQTKVAYRFFGNPQVDIQTLLHPHCEATCERIAEHPLVLVAQDTTSLNYDAHPAARCVGPISTRSDGAQGLKLHDSLALTPAGVPTGLADIHAWARWAQGARRPDLDPLRPDPTAPAQAPARQCLAAVGHPRHRAGPARGLRGGGMG